MALCSHLQVCVVRVRHSAGEIEGPCLWFLVVGHSLVNLRKIQEFVLSKLFGGPMGMDIQQQEGAPGVTPIKGAERPSTALGRGQRGLGPMLGEDG